MDKFLGNNNNHDYVVNMAPEYSGLKDASGVLYPKETSSSSITQRLTNFLSMNSKI